MVKTAEKDNLNLASGWACRKKRSGDATIPGLSVRLHWERVPETWQTRVHSVAAPSIDLGLKLVLMLQREFGLETPIELVQGPGT